MKKALTNKALADFRDMIVQVRGVPVILDSDLAQAYGVTTKALNQAVKRNIDRFPPDFMISLTMEEAKVIRLLRSQFVTLEKKGHLKYPPKAFTEHGALMAATILNSPQAVQMSVFVVRAFVAMRSMLMTQQDLAKKLAALERTLTARLDTHEHAISDIIQQIMLLLSPPPQEEAQEPPRPRIGFSVRERRAAYRAKRTKGLT
jgi:hypothetical protein